MNIIITGRHVKVTEPMKAYAREKASKVERIWSAITHIQVTMDIEHDNHVVEAIVHIAGGENIAANAKELDMYAALDMVENKIEKQLRKLKGKTQDHHPRMKESNQAGADQGPSYQDIVDEELDRN